VDVGSAVSKSFNPSDKIGGVVHGGNAANINDGVFAEYTIVKVDLQMYIPANMPME
jgi:hypothetical protein